ncbi:DUF6442 family protein [Miniphocaeibacter halophilus]|uniref:DUF2178 domain-containing protein n=1 Tax=Miniphocaeibacter halophilus TaxID=2931922 RepID=A0AC61MQN7_9FIRM|nr:DUF6442 family protein [Miniphocaeibacter halophilus]QQK06885.1 DUF2178 domain-containing protein [Miniphocaeibacter halophilus]
MLGIFSGLDAKTDKEYILEKKRENKEYLLLIIFGVICLVHSVFARELYDGISKDNVFIYSAFGIFLAVAGLWSIVNNRRVVKNEERLKKERIEHTDERNKKISIRASRISLRILIICIFLIYTFKGIKDPETRDMMSSLCLILVISYFVSYKILERKI